MEVDPLSTHISKSTMQNPKVSQLQKYQSSSFTSESLHDASNKSEAIFSLRLSKSCSCPPIKTFINEDFSGLSELTPPSWFPASINVWSFINFISFGSIFFKAVFLLTHKRQQKWQPKQNPRYSKETKVVSSHAKPEKMGSFLKMSQGKLQNKVASCGNENRNILTF